VGALAQWESAPELIALEHFFYICVFKEKLRLKPSLNINKTETLCFLAL